MTFEHSRPSLLLRLSEEASHGAMGGSLLDMLAEPDRQRLFEAGTPRNVAAGGQVFRQGDPHDGIFIILSGQVRISYSSPAGREITLAYWAPGHFIGGPEIFGGSPHMWSGQAVRPTELLHVRGPVLRRLAEDLPRLALSLLDASVHKGKCFSALIQMLGTRSALQRLAQLLVLMGELNGMARPDGIALSRTMTQEDLARLVGATRQWISSGLERLRESGLVTLTPGRILIRDMERLRALAG